MRLGTAFSYRRSTTQAFGGKVVNDARSLCASAAGALVGDVESFLGHPGPLQSAFHRMLVHRHEVRAALPAYPLAQSGQGPQRGTKVHRPPQSGAGGCRLGLQPECCCQQ